MKSPEHEARAIREYMQSQAPDCDVTHLEKLASERVLGQRYDVWDVHTDDGRWWVITSPTNLYSQDEFKSMDYALSFHIGLTARVMARNEPRASDQERARLADAWRRWTQAADALDAADEAEEFQAVGMRCRESLLAFIREVATDDMVPEGQARPKGGDFIQWSEHIADGVTAGASAARLRSYLKATAKETWQYVQWLTHANNATRFDAIVAVEATSNVISTYGMALVRAERGIPDRCPSCSSYRLTSVYRPELDADDPFVTLCEACGWEEGEALEQ